MPTSRIPVVKPEEKQVKLEEKPVEKHVEKPVVSDVNILKEKPGTSCDQNMPESVTSAPLMSGVDNVENQSKLGNGFLPTF